MNSLLIAQNIIKRAFKSGKELVLMLALPIAAIGIMTIMTGSQGAQKMSVGFVNLDKGTYGQMLVSHVGSEQNIEIVNLNEKNYKDMVKKGKSSLVVLIPESFSINIESGKKAYVEFYSSSMSAASEKLKQNINHDITGFYMISSVSDDIAASTGNDKQKVSDTLFARINENTLSSKFELAGNKGDDENRRRLISSIGFAMMFLMVFIFNTIGTIMEDKKKLTMARMFTFQVKEKEIIAGNLLGSLSLGIIQLIPVITVLALVYKIKSVEEIFGLFLILFCFMIATIGLGIGLSGIIKNGYNPSLITATVIFPTSLLGGCLVPGSMLPSFMGPIGYAVPQKWVMSAVQQLITGAGLQGIMLHLGIIMMFGIAFSTFGFKTLKPLSE